MKEQNYHHFKFRQEPECDEWEDSVWQTGCTQPPKNRGGLLALLLILVIFLCGIITVLSILNIRLFQKLQMQEDNELAISFTAGETIAEEPVMTVETGALPQPATQQPLSVASVGIDLHESEMSIENVPMEGAMSLQDIYVRNIESVVSITCMGHNSTSTGTGVIFSEQGYIVTNAHVVEGGVTLSVQLTDGRVLPAELIGRDEVTDLAVLFIDGDNLISAQFGDSSALRVGDTVVAIGDPLGVEFRGTYTDGIVSAINRDVNMDGRKMTLIQTNAALNSGNSGGPLINCYGQVVGINTMKIGTFTDRSGVEGLGFAIPSATVKDIVDQLIHQGYVSGRPAIGIAGDTLSAFYQHYYRMPAGLYITEVDHNSDAYSKGIQAGDILISLDGQRIQTMEELKAFLYGCEVGQTIQTVIYRSGQQYMVELQLREDKR